MFARHNEIKPKINNKKTARKYPNIWRLNNMSLSNIQVREDVSKENILNSMKIKLQLIEMSGRQGKQCTENNI